MLNNKLIFISLLLLLSFAPLLSAALPEPTIITNSQLESNVLTYENDYNGDGVPNAITTFTPIDNNGLEIYVNQTTSDKKYKWQSGIFPHNKDVRVLKEEYNPATDVWSNTGELVDYDYQWTTGWNLNGDTIGKSLFGAGSGDKTYRIYFSEQTKFTIFTGQGTEEVVYEWVNNTLYVYETDKLDINPFEIEILCNDEKITTPDITFTSNEPIEEGIKFQANISNFTCDGKLTFRQNKLVDTEVIWSNQFGSQTLDHFIDYSDFINSSGNNITSFDVVDYYYKRDITGWGYCLTENWLEYFNCLNSIEFSDQNYYGNFTDLDPSLTSTLVSYSGIDWQNNRTEASNLGLRTTAPILFMNFNSPADGTNIRDDSIYNNAGTVSGATYNSSCSGANYDMGGCYEFDGVNDYINNSLFDTAFTVYSYGAWVNLQDGYRRPIIVGGEGGADATNNHDFYLGTGSGNTTLCSSRDASLNTIIAISSSLLPLNSWVRLDCVYNGTSLNLYINGILDTTTVGADYADGTDGLRIGYGADLFDWGDVYLDGSIDNVQIFDRALTASEILDLYNGSVTGYNNTENIGKYAREGNFTSMVFYNSTSTYWNVTQSIADSDGGYGVNISDTNLVSYWTLDESFDDLVGGNDGTQSGGVVNATGISSGAMSFDGVDDYVSVADSDNSLDIGQGNYAISMWIYPEDFSNSPFLISKASYNVDGWRLRVGTTSGNVQLEHHLSSANDYTRTSSALSLSTWQHLVAIRDGSDVKIYFNGVEQPESVSETMRNCVVNNMDVNIGVSNTPANYFNGQIDEVLIYNRSLDASEVEALYKAGLSQHADTNVTLWTRTADEYNLSDAGLVGLWGLNGNANDELGVNNGTVSGANLSCDECGVVGQGGDFDGTNDYVDTPFNGTEYDNISFSFWARFNDVGASSGVDYLIDNSPDSSGYIIRKSNDILQIYVYYSSAGIQSVGSGIDLPDTGWHHYFFEATGDRMYLIIDNFREYENLAPNFDSIIGSSDTMRLGSTVEGGSYLNGSIDEVRIYNRTLSASEIQDLYELGKTHILWNNWTEVGVKSDLIPQTTLSNGKFMQFKDNLVTDDTDVSAYVLNYSISPTELPLADTQNPQWSNNLTNITSMSQSEAVYFNITLTDDFAPGQYIFSWHNGTTWANDSAQDWTNNTQIEVIKTIPITATQINWTWYFNDSLGNSNQTDIWSQNMEAIPIITNIFPTSGATYTSLLTISNATVTFSNGGDTVWYSLDGGVTNISQNASGGTGVYNFTGVNFVEGSNTINWWANSTNGGIGMASSTFTIDLPPTVTNGVDGVQDLIFDYSQTCSDNIGVSSQWYTWKNVNYTYTGAIDLSASAGSYQITSWCNDTFGTTVFDANTITTRDFDTNATTECNDGYYLDGDGTCKIFPTCASNEKLSYDGSSWSCVEDQTGNSTSSTTIQTCRYKKLAYYNEKLSWIREGSCL